MTRQVLAFPLNLGPTASVPRWLTRASDYIAYVKVYRNRRTRCKVDMEPEDHWEVILSGSPVLHGGGYILQMPDGSIRPIATDQALELVRRSHRVRTVGQRRSPA